MKDITEAEKEQRRIADEEMDAAHGHDSEGCYGQGVYLDELTDNDHYRGERILAIDHSRMVTSHTDDGVKATTAYRRDSLGLSWVLDWTIEEQENNIMTNRNKVTPASLYLSHAKTIHSLIKGGLVLVAQMRINEMHACIAELAFEACIQHNLPRR